MSECVDCELHPIGEFNGQRLCARHLEQEVDFAARTPAPIAFTRHVAMHPQKGASTSGTPRHYK
jgi:hypothetical protein